MFLVLIEYVDDGDHEWDVCAHGKKGIKVLFPTREDADDYARGQAEIRPNRYAVVEVRTTIQRPPPVFRPIEETPVNEGD